LKQDKSPFKWRHSEPSLILLCANWYCRYQLSYRDVEEMMRERGLEVDHSTIFRRVQRYAAEINKRIRQHLKVSGTSDRVDETYFKVGKACKYLSLSIRTRLILKHSALHKQSELCRRTANCGA
jgi:IS6 family transposase